MTHENGKGPAVVLKRTVDNKAIKNAVKRAAMFLNQKLEGSEGFLITIHSVKGDIINHSYMTEQFPDGDWGQAMLYIGSEGRRIQEMASTKKDRV